MLTQPRVVRCVNKACHLPCQRKSPELKKFPECQHFNFNLRNSEFLGCDFHIPIIEDAKEKSTPDPHEGRVTESDEQQD